MMSLLLYQVILKLVLVFLASNDSYSISSLEFSVVCEVVEKLDFLTFKTFISTWSVFQRFPVPFTVALRGVREKS